MVKFIQRPTNEHYLILKRCCTDTFNYFFPAQDKVTHSFVN